MKPWRPVILPVVLVLAALALAATLFLFVGMPETEPAVMVASESSPAVPPGGRAPGGFAAFDGNFAPPGAGLRGLGVGMDEEMTEDDFEEPWEAPINTLLDSDDENNVVAAKLAKLAPTLPLEGQVEAIQHMVNLLDDEQYELAGNMVLNPGLHPDLREVLFSDVLDRPNDVKMPLFLALLGQPGHPLGVDARQNLQAYVGRDLGPNPVDWTTTVRTMLAREAEEEAAGEASLTDEEVD
jgi:hypothetical protein